MATSNCNLSPVQVIERIEDLGASLDEFISNVLAIEAKDGHSEAIANQTAS